MEVGLSFTLRPWVRSPWEPLHWSNAACRRLSRQSTDSATGQSDAHGTWAPPELVSEESNVYRLTLMILPAVPECSGHKFLFLESLIFGINMWYTRWCAEPTVGTGLLLTRRCLMYVLPAGIGTELTCQHSEGKRKREYCDSTHVATRWALALLSALSMCTYT
jgi:hypothetical protein